MTAAERLLQLSKLSGVAAVSMLLSIGVGATTSEALVDYSQLDTATASEHLLAERVQQDSCGALLKIHRERLAKVERERLRKINESIEAQQVVIPDLPAPIVPPEQLVINETTLRYTQDDLSLTSETQADALRKREKFNISPELVKKLAEIRQVAVESVVIPQIEPDHQAMIRNNDDALAILLIYMALEDD